MFSVRCNHNMLIRHRSNQVSDVSVRMHWDHGLNCTVVSSSRGVGAKVSFLALSIKHQNFTLPHDQWHLLHDHRGENSDMQQPPSIIRPESKSSLTLSMSGTYPYMISVISVLLHSGHFLVFGLRGDLRLAGERTDLELVALPAFFTLNDDMAESGGDMVLLYFDCF